MVWKKGQSGNPRGRPPRAKVSPAVAKAMASIEDATPDIIAQMISFALEPRDPRTVQAQVRVQMWLFDKVSPASVTEAIESAISELSGRDRVAQLTDALAREQAALAQRGNN